MVVPVGARRFLTRDPDTAEVLRAAGAELVEQDAEVEIGAIQGLQGGSTRTILSLGVNPSQFDGRGKTHRMLIRLAMHARLRLRILRARRTLRRRGYPVVEVVTWDNYHAVRLPGIEPGSRPRRVSERLPRHALVVGSRLHDERTLLEVAVEQANACLPGGFAPIAPLVRSGQLVMVSDAAVLRVALAAGQGPLDAHHAALTQVAALDLPPAVRALVPAVLGHGRCGLGRWLLEQRMPGRVASRPLSADLLPQCVDFLVALFAASRDMGAPRLLSQDAAEIARVCGPDLGEAIAALAREVDARLADGPRCYGHGDFFVGNLLVSDGSLMGVIDWGSSAFGRLPAMDLLHLVFTSAHKPKKSRWGPAIIEHLLPWAEAGGDEVFGAYCDRIGLETDPAQLQALVVAYWIDRLRYQVTTYRDRMQRPKWARKNILEPLQAFSDWL